MHCFNNSGINNGAEMDDTQFLKVVNELAEIKPFNVCFSGGEPLLRKDLLLKAADILSSQGIRLSMVTNGFFLSESVVKELHEVGLKEVCLSLDSHNL